MSGNFTKKTKKIKNRKIFLNKWWLWLAILTISSYIIAEKVGPLI